MKTIVIDARGYATTTGRYTRNLIKYLEEIEPKDSKNKYLILLLAKEFDDYKPSNKNFFKKEADFGFNGFAEQFGFLKFLKEIKADLVHFTMPQQPVLYRGKHVTTMHDLTLLKVFPGNKSWLLYQIKRLVGTWVFKAIAKTSEHIITPSEFTKNEYAKFAHIDLEKITVTYESADKPSETPIAYSPLFDKKYIMYVGQQSNYKNIRRLIEAHQQLRTTLPDLHLVLVGKLTETASQNKDWVAKNSYKNVVFTDFVTDDQLAWLYENCQAYVFPSLMEGFGLPPLEAMHYGVPVVSSNATCLPEVIGNAGHYFDPENVDQMAKAINDVLTDEKLRSQLVENGSKKLKEYSWKRMAQQTLEIYKNSLQ